MEYATLEARLATFEKPSKRSKLGWPHKTPTPEELAKAGFYFKPSSSSNDNTICFLCERALGGWEPDDDPVQEHLKHSNDCGWATLMNIGQDAAWDTNDMEDPTGPQITDARRSTFALGWPHESKRGWTCKVEKMVEAGWHYAPTPESDDFVSCVYCKLSLDGWEPKDNPFDEHYRRSPECPFFHFAGTTAPSKRPKAKKGRASRTSRTSKASTRLSTQSNSTMLSEVEHSIDIPEFEESIDASEMSVMSTMSTASTATTKGKRKGAGGRAKTTKIKKTKTTRSTRVKKGQPEPEPGPELDLGAEPVKAEEPEHPGELMEDQKSTKAESMEERPSPPSQQQGIPSPPAEVAYPSIPDSPGAPDEMKLSPVGAPPQTSPTPVKARRRASARSSTVTPKATITLKPKLEPKFEPQPEATSTHSPTPQSPTPPSDIENAPPSARPASARPPVPPARTQTQTQIIPLAISSPGAPAPAWDPADVELIFQSSTPQPVDILALTGGRLSTPEKSMTVQEWIGHLAEQAEVGLRAEAERVVGIFEREGQRAMGVLESIVCV
ncbi:hypothetical protein A1O1_04814 [Capronia coronata CBS 617.96]|uniref:Uncharacterized protein n=1 Tax=Capronia coronata CBS 617.96 TaxID=1182541 RepID=W9Y522_9EURO|nr:uncharacterized protein A1O1_04814 [Capronia coronata CBS 617.96]EXJ87887.1 hypothetical protein A1O1_04814 [Capronia coronata CBS 617.96]